MASHRGSKEEKIIDYFRTAELAKVEVVYNLVRSLVKERMVKEAPAKTRAPRKPRTPKASPAAAPAAAPAEGTPRPTTRGKVTARSVAAVTPATQQSTLSLSEQAT